jgi:hypothetical protein
MVAVLVNHAFVSAKPDSPDGTIVSASEWNASALMTAGNQGQLVARDGGSVTGATYVDGSGVQINSGTYSGSSPSTDLAQLLVTNNTPANILLIATIAAVTSGGANVQGFIKRNGVAGAGVHGQVSFVIGENSPATVTWTVAVSTISGTFNSLSISFIALSLGKI